MIIKHLYQARSRPALYIIIYILLYVCIMYYLEFSDFKGGGVLTLRKPSTEDILGKLYMYLDFQ